MKRGTAMRYGGKSDAVRLGGAVLLLVAGLFGTAMPAASEDLTVGLARPASSLDPHARNSDDDRTIAFHLFDALVRRDSDQRLLPGLAIAWWLEEETRWTFQLRDGVTFHDGSPLTAADVKASLERAGANSQSGYGWLLNSVESMATPDPQVVEIRTRTPDPALPDKLSRVAIVKAGAPGDRVPEAQRAAFDAGSAAIGTGAYRFADHQPGRRVALTANPDHWAGPPAYATLVFEVIPDADERLAALRDERVQLVDEVPLDALDALAADDGAAVYRKTGNRLFYLHLDSGRDRSPFVTARDGSALERNPLQRAAVRRALSLAIDRGTLAAEVMEGAAEPTRQVVPPPLPGSSPALTPDFDLAEARALLRLAGLPDGFGLSLHVPVGRYPRGVALAQATARMLGAAGIETRVQALDPAAFFEGANRREFSALLLGWSVLSTEALYPLSQLVHTTDPEARLGLANRGGYSNGTLDKILSVAGATAHPARRTLLLEAASELAIGEAAVVPLLFAEHLWAGRKGLSFTPRTDGLTLLTGLRRR